MELVNYRPLSLMFDMINNPDLLKIDETIQTRLDTILEAEQQAAAVAARRGNLLRDRLIELEDCESSAEVVTRNGRARGLLSIAADHIAIESESGISLIPFKEIVMVTSP